MRNRVIQYWVYGGALSGMLLLLLAPLLLRGWPAHLAVTYLLLPAYMLHQWEEHDDDRFRRFLSETLWHGKEALTLLASFVINVPGVWGGITLSLYLAWYVHPGYALIAIYLVLVNAIVHSVHAIVFHRYNPGLGTAMVIFLPLGTLGLLQVNAAGAGEARFHAIGLVSAIAGHLVILVTALRHRRTLA